MFYLVASTRFRVEGESMHPNLRDGQQVLVRKLERKGLALQRGAVVAVRHPREQRRIFIKRVVGLPGECLNLGEDAVYVNGNPLAELYLEAGGCPPGRYARQWLVGEDEIFVLGDNRADSWDSRAFGPVPRNLVIGQVWWRCWPLRDWGPIHSPVPVAQRSQD